MSRTDHDGVEHWRYFTNPNCEGAKGSQPTHNQSVFLLEQRSGRLESSLAARTRQLVERCKAFYDQTPPSSLGSLYCGALGSMVYIEWKMGLVMRRIEASNRHGREESSESSESSAMQREENTDNAIQTRLEQSLRLAQQAASYHEHRSSRHVRVTLLESPYVGAKAMEVALLQSLDQPAAAQESAQTLVAWLRSKTIPSQQHQHPHRTNQAVLDPHECEVLYGRAGAIQAILFLRHELNDPQLGSSVVLELSQAIIQQGLAMASAYPQFGLPLLWHWHDTFYLGAAHGVVGILQTLLSLNYQEQDHLDRSYSMLSMIRQTIDQLNNSYCFPSGNLDSSIKERQKRARTDRLVHWCHGAVGHVLLLEQASRTFHNDEDIAASYQNLAYDIANQVIWPRGLLRKGVGLCHGISGNAYSLGMCKNRSIFSRKGSFLCRFRHE